MYQYFIYLGSPVNSWQGHRNSAWRLLHRGTASPTLYGQNVGSLVSHKIYVSEELRDGTTVYRPYLRKLKSLTVSGCMPFQRQQFLLNNLMNPSWWPFGRHTGAYSIELIGWRLKVKVNEQTREFKNSFSVRIGFLPCKAILSTLE